MVKPSQVWVFSVPLKLLMRLGSLLSWDLWVLKFPFFFLRRSFSCLGRITSCKCPGLLLASVVGAGEHSDSLDLTVSVRPESQSARTGCEGGRTETETYCFRASIRSSSLGFSRASIHSSKRSQDSSFRGIPRRKSWRKKGCHAVSVLSPCVLLPPDAPVCQSHPCICFL